MKDVRTIKYLSLLVGLLACGLIAAGCGGDDGDSASSDETSQAESSAPETAAPVATESIEEFAERFADAGAASAAQDCEVVKEFNRGSGIFLPCESETADDYADLEIIASDEFGAAGIVDYTSNQAPDGASALAALNKDGRFRLIQSLIPGSIGLSADQVGTEFDDQKLRDEAVATFVGATREEDCDAYFEVALTFTQDKKEECRLQFDPEQSIQPQLAAAPEAEPEPLGGTEAFGFHGLDTGENYRVLLTVRQYAPEEEPADTPYLVVSYRSR
jgi:hypothetical protein